MPWHPSPWALRAHLCIYFLDSSWSSCGNSQYPWDAARIADPGCVPQPWLLKHPSHTGDVCGCSVPVPAQGRNNSPALLMGIPCVVRAGSPRFSSPFSSTYQKCHPQYVHLWLVKVILGVLEPLGSMGQRSMHSSNVGFLPNFLLRVKWSTT